MKLSLKFREENQHKNPLLRAKIPITIAGLPFISGVVAGDPSDLSFSLRSNFSSGPSLSLSYHPTISTNLPFSLSLKSGVGIFGSSHDSPLIFTATFNPNPSFYSLSPVFSLHVKPHFGNFSFSKVFKSGSIKVDGQGQNGVLENGSGSDFGISDGLGRGSEKLLSLRDLKVGGGCRSGVLDGVFVAAKTCLPLTKSARVDFRWGVSFPNEGNGFSGSKASLPMLVVNKVSLERVDEGRKVEEGKKIEDGKTGDLEFLKGMCGWMSREVEDLQRENREMKKVLEGMRLQVPGSRGGSRGDERAKRGVSDSSNEFEKWKSRKGNGSSVVGEENGIKESKKSSNRMSEVESELQKAIMSASS